MHGAQVQPPGDTRHRHTPHTAHTGMRLWTETLHRSPVGWVATATSSIHRTHARGRNIPVKIFFTPRARVIRPAAPLGSYALLLPLRWAFGPLGSKDVGGDGSFFHSVGPAAHPHRCHDVWTSGSSAILLCSSDMVCPFLHVTPEPISAFSSALTTRLSITSLPRDFVSV